MRHWMVTEPVNGNSNEPVHTIYTDEAVIAEYWQYYSQQMKRVGKEPTREDCIMSWATVNWAVELTPKIMEDFINGE